MLGGNSSDEDEPCFHLEKKVKKEERDEKKEEADRINIEKLENYIKTMCSDMAKENPSMTNHLAHLLNSVTKNTDELKEKMKGGRVPIIGTRLSSLTEDDIAQHQSLQNEYTTAEIQEKLKKFTKVSKRTFFEIATKGIWVRYLKREDGIDKYRAGGFITNIDPEEKYVTLIAHHSNQSFTWNMQLDTTSHIYLHTKNVKTYRLKQLDKKYKLFPETSTFLNKWFVLTPIISAGLVNNTKGLTYIVYDIQDNKLHYPVRKQTNKDIINSLDITLVDFSTQINKGIKDQLEQPLYSKYVVGAVFKEDLDKVKKMKSRIKQKRI